MMKLIPYSDDSSSEEEKEEEKNKNPQPADSNKLSLATDNQHNKNIPENSTMNTEHLMDTCTINTILESRPNAPDGNQTINICDDLINDKIPFSDEKPLVKEILNQKQTLPKENVICKDAAPPFFSNHKTSFLDVKQDQTDGLEIEKRGTVGENNNEDCSRKNVNSEPRKIILSNNTFLQKGSLSPLSDDAENDQDRTIEPKTNGKNWMNEHFQVVSNSGKFDGNICQKESSLDIVHQFTTHKVTQEGHSDQESGDVSESNQNPMMTTIECSLLECNDPSSTNGNSSILEVENVLQNNAVTNNLLAETRKPNHGELNLNDAVSNKKMKGNNISEIEMEEDSDTSSDSNSGSSFQQSLHSSAQPFPSTPNDEGQEKPQEEWKWNSDFDASSSDESVCEEIPSAKQEKKLPIKPSVEMVELYGEESMQPVAEFPNIPFNTKDLEYIGKVSGIIDFFLKVAALPNKRQLYYDTWLFAKDGTPIGQIFDIWGQVNSPTYNIRFNSAEDIEKTGLQENDEIYFVPNNAELTKYVDIELTKQIKGSDASWLDDKEVPPEFADYSDDETERLAKLAKKKKKKQKIQCITLDDSPNDAQESSDVNLIGKNTTRPSKTWSKPSRFSRQNNFQNRNFRQTSSAPLPQPSSPYSSSSSPLSHQPYYSTPPPSLPPGGLSFPPPPFSSYLSNMQSGPPLPSHSFTGQHPPGPPGVPFTSTPTFTQPPPLSQSIFSRPPPHPLTMYPPPPFFPQTNIQLQNSYPSDSSSTSPLPRPATGPPSFQHPPQSHIQTGNSNMQFFLRPPPLPPS